MAKSSAKNPRDPGFGHWRWQRISAVITLALMVYFTYLVAMIGALDYAAAKSFVATPYHALALAVLVGAGLFHAALGVQMIIEDYVPLASGRLALVTIARGVFAIAAAASLISVGMIAGLI
ncbi:MAG: succinate dehydrogenase, hydrophobic membrane anchor protein [Candidatus Puniceispirillaceae bacterium]|jgi:succinate dehydrogenase / fumarate reductase membrane anchor subunit